MRCPRKCVEVFPSSLENLPMSPSVSPTMPASHRVFAVTLEEHQFRSSEPWVLHQQVHQVWNIGPNIQENNKESLRIYPKMPNHSHMFEITSKKTKLQTTKASLMIVHPRHGNSKCPPCCSKHPFCFGMLWDHQRLIS